MLLVGPYDGLTNALLGQSASATLIDQPPRLGGPPFRLYVVAPIAGQGASQESFVRNLRLLDGRARYLNLGNLSWLVTRWSFMRSEQPRFRTTYSYALTALPDSNVGQIGQSVCAFTSMREGDELLVAFDLPRSGLIPLSVTIMAQYFVTVPNDPVYGPLHAETNNSVSTAQMTLRTMDGGDGMTLSDS